MIVRLALLLSLAAPPTEAADIRVLTWNVESSRGRRQTSDPATIASELRELQRGHGPFDLIGLTEVPGADAAAYADAIRLPDRS